MYKYKIHNACSLHICMLFSAGRGSFLALPVSGHAEATSVHQEIVSPGRAPRRVHTRHAKSCKLVLFRGISFRLAEPRRTHRNPNFTISAFSL